MQTFLGKLKNQWEDIGKKTQDVLREIAEANKQIAKKTGKFFFGDKRSHQPRNDIPSWHNGGSWIEK